MNDLSDMLRRAARGPTTNIDVQLLRQRVHRRAVVRRGALGVVVAGMMGGGGLLFTRSPSDETTVTVDPSTTTSTVEETSGGTSTTTPANSVDSPPTSSTMNAPTTSTSSATTTTARSQERLVELPTHSEDFLPGELVFVTLAGDANLEGGCLWLVRRDGVLMSVRWAAGFHARFYTTDGRWTFELRDGNGTVVAREGDRLQVGGGQLPDQEQRLPGCQVSDEPPYYLSPQIGHGWE